LACIGHTVYSKNNYDLISYTTHRLCPVA
jgi:hypothetical protein